MKNMHGPTEIDVQAYIFVHITGIYSFGISKTKKVTNNSSRIENYTQKVCFMAVEYEDYLIMRFSSKICG